jgi:hypothetical protein
VNLVIGHKIFKDLLLHIHGQGMFSLWDTLLGYQESFRRRFWKKIYYLSLKRDRTLEGVDFTSMFNTSVIKLQEEEEDNLCWVGKKSGYFTTKLGCLVIAEEEKDRYF